MAYKIICDVCGLLGKRAYQANADKIANRHVAKKKNSGHNVDVVSYNRAIEALKNYDK